MSTSILAVGGWGGVEHSFWICEQMSGGKWIKLVPQIKKEMAVKLGKFRTGNRQDKIRSIYGHLPLQRA